MSQKKVEHRVSFKAKTEESFAAVAFVLHWLHFEDGTKD